MLFNNGDMVDVIANVDDNFNDFCGQVLGYKSEGIVQVKDQDDNVWDVGENQCELVWGKVMTQELNELGKWNSPYRLYILASKLAEKRKLI